MSKASQENKSRKFPANGGRCERGKRLKGIREAVSDLDQEILRLLMRRFNLLEKMRVNGHIEVADEKFLREAWQSNAVKVSRNPALSGKFFTMLQEMDFLPSPGAEGEKKGSPSQRREAFNLAPPQQPVDIELAAPLSCWSTQSWMYIASAGGAPVTMASCLQNDAIIDFIKALVQAGGALTREEGAVTARAASPLGAPDKIIYVGDNLYNLCLLTAHYIGRPSRVKFVGGESLKLADLSWLRDIAPGLGARLTWGVPKSCGLPIKLECSGLLPAGCALPQSVPALFAEALILAAPFFDRPFAVDLAEQLEANSIRAHVLPLLQRIGATYEETGTTIAIDPSPLTIPQNPNAPMEASLGTFLFGLAFALGGKTRLHGSWPQWPECEAIIEGMRRLGMPVDIKFDQAEMEIKLFPGALDLRKIPDATAKKILRDARPAFVAFAACAALKGGKAYTGSFAQDEESSDFLRAAGLEADDEGRLLRRDRKSDSAAWNAPSPQWGVAFSLVACGRTKGERFELGNPGILTEFWPAYWNLYNALPAPHDKKQPKPEEKARERRRIRTQAAIEIPENPDRNN